jgi:UDP-N-acetylglucosamine:LPS N-acetylglucosamine transferase
LKNVFSNKDFQENFLEYLKASKGIITQAGHLTLSECLALKKPSLIFPIPNFIEQELNAYFAEEHKISLVRKKKNFTKHELLSIIEEFITMIPELEKNFDNLDIETNGAEQAAAIIEKFLLAKQRQDKQHKSQGP